MTRILRHLKTGTVCPARDCDECALEWFLAGEVHWVVEDSDPGERARAMQVPKPPPVPDGQEALFTL